MKYIIVTGGVVSGIGKGITISSIGRILKACGLRVTSIKIDPYLNVDAGTMSPYEHGETFVLDDGGETDLDLGNYERFLDITLTKNHNITTGKVYSEVINSERKGDYLGKTVQIVPHVTDYIQKCLREVSRHPVDNSGFVPDICLVEVGGTVGDIESMIFLEALRQFQFEVGKENIMLIHVSLVPCLGSDKEQKTKPTQHGVKELRSLGLSPDAIVCRSPDKLTESTIKKISIFCQVETSAVLSVYDVSNIYHVPLILVDQGIHKVIKKCLNIEKMSHEPDLHSWSEMASIVDFPTDTVTISIVGKYTGLSDSYLSLTKSLIHSGISLGLKVNIDWVSAEDLEVTNEASDKSKFENAWATLEKSAGVIIAGGFGHRGVEGKIAASKYCREKKKYCLGICLGMQVMVIEYARNVLGRLQANSAEFDEATPDPAIIFMPEINPNIMGGTMRLGTRDTIVSIKLDDGGRSLASDIYDLKGELSGIVRERHRHRYEVNPDLVSELTAKGLIFSGRDETNKRMEIVELNRKDHPFYFGTQFHPEFKSKPYRPSPPFFAFIAAASNRFNQLSLAGTLRSKHENKY